MGLKGSLRAVQVFGKMGNYALSAEGLERSPQGLVFSVYFEVPPEVAATRAVARVAGGTAVYGPEGTHGRDSPLFMKEVLRVETTGVTMICGREATLVTVLHGGQGMHSVGTRINS